MRKDKHTELMEVASWLGTQPGCRYVPPNDALRRGLVTLDAMDSDTEAGIDSDLEHSVVATISTRGKDRAGDIVEPAGVDLSGFRKNPVVMFAHNYGAPAIAKSAWERIDDTGIKAKPLFHLKTALSREVYELYRDGIMKAWSIGFIPTEFEEIKGKDDLEYGCSYHITRWELLEYSAVPVPCNAEAVTDMLKAGKLQAPLVVKSLEAWLADQVAPVAIQGVKCNKCGEPIYVGEPYCWKCGDEIKRPVITISETGDEGLAEDGETTDDAETVADPVVLTCAEILQRVKRLELQLDEQNERAQVNTDEKPEPAGKSDETQDDLEPEGNEPERQVLEISAEDLARRLDGVESGVIRRLRGQLD